MLNICLKKIGRKDFYLYKIVVILNLKQKIIKKIGYYNATKKIFYINYSLLSYFINVGAYLSKTVKSLILKDLKNYNIKNE